MVDPDYELQKRFFELSRRAYCRGCYTHTEFLTLAEQDALLRIKWDRECAPFVFAGGYAQAERKLACFGEADCCGCRQELPVACLLIKPLATKFAVALTHRDYLGAMMALGLRRQILGDIVLAAEGGYLFCLADKAEYIGEQLRQVNRTAVSCEPIGELPSHVETKPSSADFVVASIRLDAVVAGIYQLSRSESQNLIRQGKVYVDDRIKTNVDYPPIPGQRISVRGYGRFVFEQIGVATKKGRLRIAVSVY
ncbi:MAG: YlmH/Sll1252 family protein [Clostridiales bacterium]